MFMYAEVQRIIQARAAYESVLTQFITRVTMAYQTTQPPPTAMQHWLEWCVVDPRLIAEIEQALGLPERQQ